MQRSKVAGRLAADGVQLGHLWQEFVCVAATGDLAVGFAVLVINGIPTQKRKTKRPKFSSPAENKILPATLKRTIKVWHAGGWTLPILPCTVFVDPTLYVFD